MGLFFNPDFAVGTVARDTGKCFKAKLRSINFKIALNSGKRYAFKTLSETRKKLCSKGVCSAVGF